MSARKANVVRRAPAKAAAPAKPPETFWTRLASRSGTMSLGALEKACDLGHGTLGKCQARGGTPSVGVALTLARYLDIKAEDLLGPQTPPELRNSAPAAPADPALRRIPLANLTRSHLNPRRIFDEDALAELADSIAAQGLLQNLVVRRDADQPAIYWIVAGERRLRAMEILAAQKRLPADLAEHGIPCRVVTGSDEEHVILALLENLQRVDVNPMDEAEALARLQSLDPAKYSTKALADMLGVTTRKIQYSLKIARDLIDDAREKLRAGEITLGHARALSAAPIDDQAELLNDAVFGVSPGDLLSNVTDRMMPAAFALFDIEASGLETFIDDATGDMFIVNEAEALKRQRAVVDAKRQELLAAGRPWVNIETWLSPHQYLEGGPGVVIVMNHSGQVTIYPDRAMRAVQADGSVQARLDGDRRYRKEHQEAARAIVVAIGQNMTQTDACAIVLFDHFMGWQHQVCGSSTSCKDDSLIKLAKQFGVNGAHAGDPARQLSFFQKLLQMQIDPDISRAFIAVHAIKIAFPRPGTPLSPVLQELANRIGRWIPPILLDNAKMREERIQQWLDADAGQTDIEDAIDADMDEAMQRAAP